MKRCSAAQRLYVSSSSSSFHYQECNKAEYDREARENKKFGEEEENREEEKESGDEEEEIAKENTHTEKKERGEGRQVCSHSFAR